MAPLRRKSTGSFTPKTEWLLYAENRVAPFRRKFTDGTVHYQFSIKRHLPSGDGAFPLQGRVFGALVSCAGLAQWPVMGTVVVDGEQIVLAFRAMTVDAATCGAIDYIVHLDSATLSGPLQLYNNRKDFSNESTLAPATCTSPATTVGPVRRSIGVDSQGNPAS